jgi:hypothetical protein
MHDLVQRPANRMSSRPRNLIRLEAAYRLLILKHLYRFFPVVLVTEYPKSGGSWLAQMLAEVSGFDFPRQRFPRLRPSIFHGHYRFDDVRVKTVVFWRDPRDIMVSWYHHCLFKSDRNNPELVDRINRHLGFRDNRDLVANLPRFIDYSFTESLSPRFSFNDFFDTWYGRDDVLYSSYERLKQDTAGELRRICTALDLPNSDAAGYEDIAAAYSFQAQAARAPGTESKQHYLRKGIVGDWKNSFSREAGEVLGRHLGRRLVLLGYEPDGSWVEALT